MHSSKLKAITFILIPPVAGASLFVWLASQVGLFGATGIAWLLGIWLLGLTVLLTEFLYVVISLGVSALCGKTEITEGPITDDGKTAVLYVVKNEHEPLDENIRLSLVNNTGPSIDFWLLSDQTNSPECLELERQICESLHGRLKYYHRASGKGWKRGMLHEWLRTNEGSQYQFIVICDADTVLPSDTVKALLKKAMSPENKDVAIFQSLIAASVPPLTYFAKWLQSSQETSQRIYVRVLQHIFGHSMFFGSGALIRAHPYRDLLVPANALSHDIWDTAFLETNGWRTVFCEDIVTFEQYPLNYLQAIQRESRWLIGTLQAIPLAWYSKVKIGTRFNILRSAYSYLLQPFFLVWIFLGLIGSGQIDEVFMQNLITASPLVYSFSYLGPYSGWIGGPGALMVSLIWFGLWLVIAWANRIPDRGNQPWRIRLSEILWSTLLHMNNLVYISTAAFLTPFILLSKELASLWQPPIARYRVIRWREAIIAMLPSTMLGAFGLLVAWQINLRWMMAALPVLLSFILSIPILYVTAKELRPPNQSQETDSV